MILKLIVSLILHGFAGIRSGVLDKEQRDSLLKKLKEAEKEGRDWIDW